MTTVKITSLKIVDQDYQLLKLTKSFFTQLSRTNCLQHSHMPKLHNVKVYSTHFVYIYAYLDLFRSFIYHQCIKIKGRSCFKLILFSVMFNKRIRFFVKKKDWAFNFKQAIIYGDQNKTLEFKWF